MKKLLLFVILILLGNITIVSAQTSTITFEGFSSGSTSFTDNGYTFNIVSQAGTFRVQANYPNTGWNGTANDNVYIDNTGTTNINAPSFSVKSNSGFTVSKFWVFLSNTALNQTTLSGNLIITGKLGGVTQFTTTKTSGFNNTFNATTGTTGVNNGFTLIDLATLNSQNNSNTLIDEIQLQSTGDYVYMCLDAFTWTKNVVPIVITPDVNGVLYVKKGSAGNGSSWGSAVGELADALKAAKTNTAIKTIWVAGGNYKPLYAADDLSNGPNATNRQNSFVLVKDVKVYGGFAGTETQLSQRNWTLNKTILSGEMQNDANSANNAYHVVISAADIGTATLDGFTVSEGVPITDSGQSTTTVNGATLTNRFAGGIYCVSSSPLIKNCLLTNNTGYEATAFRSVSGSPVVVNTVMSGNPSTLYNIVLVAIGNPVSLINVSIVNNRCTFPLKMDNGTLYNSIVWGNTILATTPNPLTITIQNSIVQKGIFGTTDIGTDPLFKNLSGGDYSLGTGSPAINGGDNALYPAGLNTDKDFAGNSRLIGSNIDLGAYEAAFSPNASGIFFVKKGANGTGNSWANAVGELADALVAAKTNTAIKEIWVAGGTYKPMYSPADNNFGNADGRNNAFLLVKDVKVYGGFAGTETTLAQRNLTLTANKSILSGDFNNDDVITGSGATLNITGNSENIPHVVISTGAVGTAELNGFTITGGNANINTNLIVNGANVLHNYGGGMYNASSSPAISQVVFTGNNATFGGGGMYNSFSSPTISQSSFTGNNTTSGGGMYNFNSSSPVINQSNFMGNKAIAGGGMYNFNSSSPAISQSSFTDNKAVTGGGMSNLNSSSPAISQSSFTGNNATSGGGMYNLNSSSPVIQNSLFSANGANQGGALFCTGNSTKPLIHSTTFSANQANGGGQAIYAESGSQVSLVHSIIWKEAGFAGNNNLQDNNASFILSNCILQYPGNGYNITGTYQNADPLFTDADGADNIFGTADDDLTLKPNSPAINAGNNSLYTGNINTDKDLAGNNRLFGTNIDLGAYEVQVQAQTITAGNLTKTYGDADFEPGAAASSGLTVSYVSADNSIAEAYQDVNDANKWKLKIKKVGNVSITASQAGGNGYAAAPDKIFALAIQPKALTVTATGNNKIYDATTTATVNLSSNVLAGDVVTLTYASATFSDKNVGINKAITVNGISLSGTDAANYTFNTTATATANITPFALTVSATGNNRVYNANNNATVTLTSNAFVGDNLALAYTSATFNNKTVANGKAVSVSSISLSGTDAVNYTFNTTATATANITPFALTVSATGNNRVYNANNNATVTLTSNAFAGDNLALAYTSATFNDKTVANGKAVSVSGISLSGTDANNYTFNTIASTTANVTPFALTVSATGNNRVYNANNNATVNLSHNAFAGDNLTLAYTSATFNNKTVANGKAVSVSGISLSGTDANNYIFNTTASTTANVTPFALTISASANNRTYNGNTDATATLSHNGFAGDVLTLNYTAASFDNKNVGNSKPVSISGISLSGTDAGNYTFSTTASTIAAITPASLNIVAQAKNKTYGDADPALTYTSTGLIGADVIGGNLNRNSGENVNTYPITQGTLSAGPNYVVSFTGNNLVINKANLTVTAANVARCFGQANPSFALNYSGFKFNDNENSLTTKPQATTTANASSAAGNYAITVSGGSTSNYTLIYANGTLRVDALPNITVVPSREGTIGKGLTLQLIASGGSSYSWANAQGIISGQNSATLTIRPTVNTTYTVTVTNNNGCSSTASYAVAIVDDLSIVKATNLLSPNGDGVNDVWKVDNIDMYPQAMVRIFDKAGRIVYTRKGYDNSWDGTYNGQQLAENTYYYIIDLEAGKVLRGYITLVRDR